MISLRLFIDTNILVSAALNPSGLERSVLLIATTKPASLYVSDAILNGYQDVLARRELKIRKALRQEVLQLIASRARTVKPSKMLAVTTDPDDNAFLECADAARADYLITGNTRHFPKFWKKTKVITPREFIDLVAPHLFSRR